MESWEDSAVEEIVIFIGNKSCRLCVFMIFEVQDGGERKGTMKREIEGKKS